MDVNGKVAEAFLSKINTIQNYLDFYIWAKRGFNNTTKHRFVSCCDWHHLLAVAVARSSYRYEMMMWSLIWLHSVLKQKHQTCRVKCVFGPSRRKAWIGWGNTEKRKRAATMRFSFFCLFVFVPSVWGCSACRSSVPHRALTLNGGGQGGATVGWEESSSSGFKSAQQQL